jgi:hypothetical protein
LSPTCFHPDNQPALRLPSSPTVSASGGLQVIDNPHWGIKGGWQVDLTLVILTPVPAWTASLPASTAALMPSYFPNFFASEVKSQFTISAISQLTSWLTTHYVVDVVEAMLVA